MAGLVVTSAAAILLFGCWGLNGALSRDEAVYAYGGQQLAHGVPPYESIFDPKTPGATIIAGIASLFTRLFGGNDVYAIRSVFFLCSCLAVVLVYLLTRELFRSTLAGVSAAVVFGSFTGFAEDALSGPDAKTPGILAGVLALWLLLRHRWFWGAVAASAATVVWQPFLIFPIVAIVAAGVGGAGPDRRRRLTSAAAGVLAPWVVVLVYFLASGALGKLVQAAFVFPLTGIARAHRTLAQRIQHIASVVHSYYGFSGYLLVVGAVGLVVLAVLQLRKRQGTVRAALKEPLLLIVMSTMIFEYGYALLDFQGYPDVYPLLPYAALGCGGLVGVALARPRRPGTQRMTAAVITAGLLGLTVSSTVWFVTDAGRHPGLPEQNAMACAVKRVLGPQGTLLALGDPSPLVLMHRRNPDRYIYLNSGVGHWKLTHNDGGFAGWTAQLAAWQPDVIVSHAWSSGLERRINTWLTTAGGYDGAYIGSWRVYLTPAAAAAATTQGVELTARPGTGPTACSPGSAGAPDTTGIQP